MVDFSKSGAGGDKETCPFASFILLCSVPYRGKNGGNRIRAIIFVKGSRRLQEK